MIKKECKPMRLFLISFIFKIIPPSRMHGVKSALLRWAGAEVGKNVEITSSVKIYGNMQLHIGNNVYLGHEAMLFGGKGCKIIIEDYAKVGSRVTIPAGFHEITPQGDCIQGKGTASTILIKKGSAVSTGCLVLPGVIFGSMSHAAAGSVIIKEVPDFVRVAGVPAKIVRNFKTEHSYD